MSLHGPRTRVVLTDKQKEKAYRLKHVEGIPMSTLKDLFGCSISSISKACREVEERKAASRITT